MLIVRVGLNCMQQQKSNKQKKLDSYDTIHWMCHDSFMSLLVLPYIQAQVPAQTSEINYVHVCSMHCVRIQLHTGLFSVQ